MRCARGTIPFSTTPEFFLAQLTVSELWPPRRSQAWPIDGSYDFLFLPMRSGGRLAMGWAILNFASAAHADAFTARWHWRRLPGFHQGRQMRVTVAGFQGMAWVCLGARSL